MPPKTTAAKKNAPEHPTFQVMITEAITALKDRAGSSRQSLKKYILGNYKVNETLFGKNFNRYLAAGVEHGHFTQPKGPSGPIKLVKKESGSSAAPAKKAPAKTAAAKKQAATKKATPSSKTKVDVPARKKVATGTKAKAAKAKAPAAAKKADAPAAAKKAAPKKKAAATAIAKKSAAAAPKKAAGGKVAKAAPKKKAAPAASKAKKPAAKKAAK